MSALVATRGDVEGIRWSRETGFFSSSLLDRFARSAPFSFVTLAVQATWSMLPTTWQDSPGDFCRHNGIDEHNILGHRKVLWRIEATSTPR